jgi:hypothetical protein
MPLALLNTALGPNVRFRLYAPPQVFCPSFLRTLRRHTDTTRVQPCFALIHVLIDRAQKTVALDGAPSHPNRALEYIHIVRCVCARI